MEDRLVQHAPLIVVAPQVQRLRVFQQGERSFDQPCGFEEILGGLAKPFRQVLAPSLDVPQPCSDLGLGHLLVSRQVEQVLLLAIQRLQLGGELVVQQPRGSILFVNGRGQVGTDLCEELRAEADGGVVLLDGFFQSPHVDMWCGARPVLPASAEEVHVDVALAIDCLLHDHALGDAAGFAGTAEQRAFEVMMVDAAALHSRCPRFYDVLDPFKQLVAD